MIIEIKGTNFHNKGAELMLHTVVQRFKEKNDVLVADYVTGDYEKRINLGLYQKLLLPKLGPKHSNKIEKFIPDRLAERYGVVKESKVDAILDVSGFAYSDQWGDGPTKRMADLSEKWRKKNKKIILMPQAFGPFSSNSIKKNMTTIISNANLIFARDKTSYNYLVENLKLENKVINKIHLSPDFTNTLSITNELYDYYSGYKNRPCIIPNYRMIDKLKSKDSESYFNTLVFICTLLNKKGYKPFFLIHDTGNDWELVQSIKKQLSTIKDLDVVYEEDPINIKAIIGSSLFVIGSRFHGIVSALSQGVPALVSGWSHKYVELLNNYEIEGNLFSLNESYEEIESKINKLLNPKEINEILTKIEKNSEKQKKEVDKMWNLIEEELYK